MHHGLTLWPANPACKLLAQISVGNLEEAGIYMYMVM